MKSSDALRNLAGRVSLQDVLDSFRERYGKRASREIANRYGVTMRTAQRALKGETRAPKFAATEKFAADVAAAQVRQIRTAHVGEVTVEYDGEDAGSRVIGDVEFEEGDLDEVADHLQNGDWDAAGEALDAAILDQYGGLGGTLTISDYETGLSFD